MATNPTAIAKLPHHCIAWYLIYQAFEAAGFEIFQEMRSRINNLAMFTVYHIILRYNFIFYYMILFYIGFIPYLNILK